MITFLFWNINRKPLENLIADLVEEHQVDVLMLAESIISHDIMLMALNKRERREFHMPLAEHRRISTYIRFNHSFFTLLEEQAYFKIWQMVLPARIDILLAAVHFPSTLFWKGESLDSLCKEFAEEIRKTEETVGHRRTILVGDINMNPFENSVVDAYGLHAVMTRDIASRGERIIQNKKYPFFYNPMWSRFGDTSEGPAGTYYYERSEHKVFFWNIFDQVLVRPELLAAFRNEDMKVLTEHDGTSFLSRRGIPDKSVASDHLPILFKLNL